MSIQQEMQATIEDMVQEGKGILAADESAPTIDVGPQYKACV